MFDPFHNMRRYIVWTFILIIFLLITGIAVAGEQVLHSKIKSISPDKVDVNIVLLKLKLVQEGDTITKKRNFKCADGRNTRYLKVIGSYLLSFITMMSIHLNTADIIVGQDMLLKTE